MLSCYKGDKLMKEKKYRNMLELKPELDYFKHPHLLTQALNIRIAQHKTGKKK